MPGHALDLMPGQPYTTEQREEALRIYVEDGPDEAATATGISVRTIYRWAAAEGVSTTATSEKTQAATSAAKARATMVRAEVRSLLIEQAAKVLHSMDELQPHKVTVIEGKTRSESFEMIPAAASDKKDLAITAATLIDKFRLEGGESTGRMETLSITDGLPTDVKRALRDRLARSVRGEHAVDRTDGDAGRAGEGVAAGETPDPA